MEERKSETDRLTEKKIINLQNQIRNPIPKRVSETLKKTMSHRPLLLFSIFLH